jgi:hypothetical protein
MHHIGTRANDKSDKVTRFEQAKLFICQKEQMISNNGLVCIIFGIVGFQIKEASTLLWKRLR